MSPRSAVGPSSRQAPPRRRQGDAEGDGTRHGLEHARATRRTPTEEVDLNDLVAEIAASLPATGPAPEAFATGELPRLRGVRSLLRGVLTDLMRNALEYARVDEPRVLISAARSGRAWEIRFDDNGDGFSTDHRERIFDRFPGGAGQRGGGAGPSLALCRRSIESLGGTIDAASGPLGGCRVRFTLPDEPPALSRE